jgi:hypothetical protein
MERKSVATSVYLAILLIRQRLNTTKLVVDAIARLKEQDFLLKRQSLGMPDLVQYLGSMG